LTQGVSCRNPRIAVAPEASVGVAFSLLAKVDDALRRTQSPLARAALKAALSEHARAAAQRSQLVRLCDGLEMEPTELPYLFAEQLGTAELRQLADALEVGLA